MLIEIIHHFLCFLPKNLRSTRCKAGVLSFWELVPFSERFVSLSATSWAILRWPRPTSKSVSQGSIFQSRIYLLLPARITLLTDAHVFTIRLQLELDIWPSTCWLSTYTLSACLACFVHTDFLHAKHPLWILSIYEAYFLYTDFTLWPSTSLLYTNWLSMYDFPHLSIISRFWLYIPAFHIIGLLSVYQLSKHPLYFLTFWTHSTYPYQHANCLPPT